MLHYEKKLSTVMFNNSFNINKTNYHIRHMPMEITCHVLD